jgi:hypothetical protein
MGALETLLQYIRQSERLVVVTLTVTIAGLALFAVEQWQLFDVRGLPEWVRPAALIVWALCAVHVAIRTVMALSKGTTATARFIASIPQRRQAAAYRKRVINRLLRTDGLAREVLCYALYWDDDSLWVRARDRNRLRWLLQLSQDGLVATSWVHPEGDVQYRLHHVVWEYMRKHPNSFVGVLPWRAAPWLLDLDEDEVEREILWRHGKPRT